MARLTRSAALDILQRCAISPGANYFTLSGETVMTLLREADAYGYRRPRSARGSRGRCFHEFVQRVASRKGG